MNRLKPCIAAIQRRASLLMFTCCASLMLATHSVWAQVHTGEVRLKVTDQAGLALKASISLSNAAEGYRKNFETDAQGSAKLKGLSFGLYSLRAERQGFGPASVIFEVRSTVPSDRTIKLQVAAVNTTVQVSAPSPLVDPYQPSSVMQIGSQQIQQRVGSLPGRSVQDLVNTQPGWLYEGNAVLHPRGSEYQTQFVVDGIPLTDNRSPSFGPEIEADDLDSMSVYTAGFPAEYGRKLGGVVELDTHRDTTPGLHGQLVLSGGSYDTASSYGRLQDVWGRNTVSASASGSMTDHYLNPVVPQNYTNNGTTGDFSMKFERDLSDSNQLSVSLRHEFSRFLIPNELVQQEAGQHQNGDNFETLGSVRYQHTFSADRLVTLAGMVRDNANDLYSNPQSTPIVAFQHNGRREGYLKGMFSLHHGRHELKGGVESDTTFLHEDFRYTLADSAQFAPNTPSSLSFVAGRPDLEQSAFAEDLIRLGNWTISAGLRWDHYQLLLNQNAFSPRLSLGRYIPAANTVLHISYDRIFQTPSSENILISSSPQIDALDRQFLRLPVRPSLGNYYEGGSSTSVADRVRLDLNVYRRDAGNFADDDQLLNTGVTYPISFDHAVIYGGEGKLELVRTGKLTGYLSYSYMVSAVWFPVTGGLFLGDSASAALTQLSGHFPDSQDQRNTLRTRFQYQLAPRLWVASGAAYGSGLPFAYTGDQADALAQYGSQVVSRLNFNRGRVLPQLSINSSLGVDAFTSDHLKLRFQADGTNLNNRLNAIDFGGLFSGNAIGPARSFSLRLNTTF